MTEHREHEGLGLAGLLRVLRRRAGIALLCFAVVPTAALAFSLAQPNKYTAKASLLFRDPRLDVKLFGSTSIPSSTDPDREAATNLKLVSLAVVADRTAKELGHGLTGDDVHKKVGVEAEGKSEVVSVTVTDRKPAYAARVANTFTEEFIRFRRQADRSKITGAQTLIRQQLQSLTPNERRGGRARSLQRQAEELKVLASLQTGNAELVQPAEPPTSPSSPRPVRNTAVGAVLGLILGLAVALLFERLDRRVRDPKEIETIFDRPILGAIPHSRALAKDGPTTETLPAADAEAFRMLRANLRYFNVDQHVQTVLVTSAAPGDGKSTVAWNLASAAAGAGSKTLLIEADLRHPSLATARGVQPVPGLSHILAGDSSLADVVHEAPVPQRGDGRAPSRTLDVVAAGPLPPNPTDLIESNRMTELIKFAERTYDLIVIDTPPTSVVSDAIPLVKQVNGVIVVSRLGKSTRDSVQHLHRQLENLHAPILGIVVNAISTRRGGYGYGYGYGDSYGYGYGEQDRPEGSRRGRRRKRNGASEDSNSEDALEATEPAPEPRSTPTSGNGADGGGSEPERAPALRGARKLLDRRSSRRRDG